MAKTSKGHIQQLPSGSCRVKVYAGTDPVTGKPFPGMTRGRQSNTAHVVTGKTAQPGHELYQQAAPEAVLADVLQREADDLSATDSAKRRH
jgi:hypothetical protein